MATPGVRRPESTRQAMDRIDLPVLPGMGAYPRESHLRLRQAAPRMAPVSVQAT